MINPSHRMNNGILCSIVMPVYNVEKFLSRMLDSVIAQTYKNWELIIVNDGSTDNTENILKVYSKNDDRITYFNQTNSGCGPSRVNGALKAKGEYLFQIDGDDILAPNYIEVMLDAIVKTDSDMVWCNCHPNEDSSAVWNLNFEEDPDTMIKAILLRKQFYSVWLNVYKTEIAKDCIEVMRTVPFCEDWAFLVAYLLRCKKIKHIADPLYYYNLQNLGSLTHTSQRNRIPDYCKVLDSVHSSIEKVNRMKDFEYELNYSKLYVVRDYVHDKRFRDYAKFVRIYPEAISHIWDYPNYPTRLKISAWLIKKRLDLFVPIVCKIDALLRRFGMSNQI